MYGKLWHPIYTRNKQDILPNLSCIYKYKNGAFLKYLSHTNNNYSLNWLSWACMGVSAITYPIDIAICSDKYAACIMFNMYILNIISI